jgi:hypothetical protein
VTQSTIVRRRSTEPQLEPLEYVIENTRDACKILQRELMLRAMRRTRAKGYTFKDLAASAGCADTTLRKIADGTTHWPMLRTCLLIFHALGYEVLVRKTGRGISKR